MRHLNKKGDFHRVHPLRQSGLDVPDDIGARLVLLGIDHLYGKDAANPAITATKAIVENRGNTPLIIRNTLLIIRNTLVFLAVDHTRL